MTDMQSNIVLKMAGQGFTATEIAEAMTLPEADVARLLAEQGRNGPLRAITYADRRRHRAELTPGSLWFSDAGEGEQAALWFVCPCGCGMLSRITVGHRHKPKLRGPTWHWNGSRSEPTLEPSVNIRRNSLCPGWHGWLRDGYWEKC